jgi:hypothetical protein
MNKAVAPETDRAVALETKYFFFRQMVGCHLPLR